MTHSEERSHWIREGIYGQMTGILYGVTSICVGHPFDTIKTKMQGQAGYEKTNMFGTLTKTLRTQGIIGLYRGCIPPLWGSGIYRSTQFAVYEALYTRFNSPFLVQEIPYTAGLQPRVFLAGAFASTTRALIETPLEFAKVRRQTQQSWKLSKIYTGFGVTWARTLGLMGSYFVFVDEIRRNFPEHFKRPFFGPFLTSGISATLAWWIVWPLEYMKSQVQCSYGRPMSTLERLKLVYHERGGFFGLYRGLGPGTIRSFLSNGTSMVVMNWAQRKISELGLRK